MEFIMTGSSSLERKKITNPCDASSVFPKRTKMFFDKVIIPKDDLIHIVKTAIFKVTKTTFAEWSQKNRKREYVELRHMFFYFVHEYSRGTITLQKLGKILSKDHTTVIHSVKTSRNLIETNVAFSYTAYAIYAQIRLMLKEYKYIN